MTKLTQSGGPRPARPGTQDAAAASQPALPAEDTAQPAPTAGSSTRKRAGPSGTPALTVRLSAEEFQRITASAGPLAKAMVKKIEAQTLQTLKTQLSAELDALHRLAGMNCDQKVMELAIDYFFKNINSLSETHQVDAVLHIIEYIEDKSLHLKKYKNLLIGKLAELVPKIDPSHPKQFEVFYILCQRENISFLSNVGQYPWDSKNPKALFDFVARAIQASPSGFLQDIQTVTLGLQIASNITPSELSKYTDNLMESVAKKAAHNPDMAIVNRLRTAYLPINIEIFSAAVDKMMSFIGNQRTPAEMMVIRMEVMAGLNGMPDQLFHALQESPWVSDCFALSSLIQDQPNASKRQKSETMTANIKYIQSLQLEMGFQVKRSSIIKDYLNLMLELAKRNPGISHSLALMPNGNSKISIKLNKSTCYSEVKRNESFVTGDVSTFIHTAHQTHKEIEPALKNNIKSQIDGLIDSNELEVEDINQLAELFECASEIFDDDELVELREKLFKLLLKIKTIHPQLVNLIKQLMPIDSEHAVAEISTAKVKVQQLIQVTASTVIASGTSSFEDGLELLMTLDGLLRKVSADCKEEEPVPKIENLVRQHIENHATSQSKYIFPAYTGKPYSLLINEAKKEQSAKAQQIQRDACMRLLDCFSPITDEGGEAAQNTPSPKPTAAAFEMLRVYVATKLAEQNTKAARNPQASEVIAEETAIFKNRVLHLFAETVFEPADFLNNINIIQWLKYEKNHAQLEIIINTVEKLEARDSLGVIDLVASFADMFCVTQKLLTFTQDDPKITARIHAIEDRHIARLGGEKRDRLQEARDAEAAQARAEEERTAQDQAYWAAVSQGKTPGAGPEPTDMPDSDDEW
jgi:hypothetical protein